MKTKTAVYWIATGLLAFMFLPGGVMYLVGAPAAVSGVMQLGFPRYFVTLLGVWKLLGGLAILVPGVPRLKEWAYAGMFFDLTAAVVACAARGGAWWHVFAPAAAILILFASWALRPPGRAFPPRPSASAT